MKTDDFAARNPATRPGLMQRLARLLLGAGHARGDAGHGLDRLEERTLLFSTSPLPTLAQLESPTNTVVRMETTSGDIDIELFDAQAPITVSNFLNYIRTGRYAETFFHRLVPGFVLQGGGFAYSDTGGFTDITTDAPIQLETARDHDARTIAMARFGGQPNSATNQFFFNLVDNDASLSPTTSQDGFGYAVFGRVIQGWTVVESMAAFQRRNLVNDPAWAGDPNRSAFNEVPVTPFFNPSAGVRENALPTVTNVEVIKPSELQGFYTQTWVMPEGWRSGSTTEVVELFNPNSVAMRFELLARYEVSGRDVNFDPGSRDQSITRGTIPANTKVRVTLSSTQTGFTPVVRADEGYAMIINAGGPESATNLLPLAATVLRDDFRASTSADFVEVRTLAEGDGRLWSFPRIERNATSLEFMLFYNPNPQTATINVDFVTPEGPRTITITLEGYRRGGLGLAEQGLAEGILGARVRSSIVVVATLSDWDLPGEGATGPTVYTPGFMTNGFKGGSVFAGGLARVTRFADNRSEVALYNPNPTSTSVEFTAYRDDGTTATATAVVLPLQRTVVPVDFGLTNGQSATLFYRSLTVGVAAQYTVIPPDNRNQASSQRVDGETTMFSRDLARRKVFAGGTYDPTITGPGPFRETVAIFNPFADATLSIRVEYVFTDGTVIEAANAPVSPRRRVEVSTLNQASVVSKISSGAQFRNYAIVVTGSATIGVPQVVTDVAGLVSYVREDERLGRSILTDGTDVGIALAITDPPVIGAAGGSGGGG